MREECAKFGRVDEIKVPTSDNAACTIYVRFASAGAASAALLGLRGRKFDGRTVEVALCPLEVFAMLVDGA